MNNQTARHDHVIELTPLFRRTGFLIWTLLIATGCGETFQPLQENDRYYFSIFGYLDASADTQIVRIIPLRESILELPSIDDVTVTLAHLESGEESVMKDSLYQFSFDQAQSYNYLTAIEILPEQSYRLVARHADGRSSGTTVTIPPEFPEPWFSRSNVLIVEGVERLAEARIVYHLQYTQAHGRSERFTVTIPNLEQTHQFAPTSHRVFLSPGRDLGIIAMTYCGATILDREIFIASAGPEWVDFLSLDEILETHPDEISNIDNGTGFLAGIVSRVVPYDQNLPTRVTCEDN